MDVHVGLVGFGFSSRVLHVPLIQSAGMSIRAVVSRQTDAVRALLPTAHVITDLGALLALPGLDLVVIATPNDMHESQAQAALAAGKWVLVDKPLVTTVAAAERLTEMGRRHPGRLTVFHNRRWDSDFLTVRRLLAEGQLGTVHSYEARWNRYRPKVPDRWREQAEHGGGLLLDLGPHLIDQALDLFGFPEWLQADVCCQRAGALVDDAFEIRMGQGALRITLAAGCLCADAGPRFRLHGDQGSFSKSGLDVQEQQLRVGRRPDESGFGVEPDVQRGVFVDGVTGRSVAVRSERGVWLEFYQQLRASIESGAPLPVPLEAACQGLRLIEAAQRSSREGIRIRFA